VQQSFVLTAYAVTEALS